MRKSENVRALQQTPEGLAFTHSHAALSAMPDFIQPHALFTEFCIICDAFERTGQCSLMTQHSLLCDIPVILGDAVRRYGPDIEVQGFWNRSLRNQHAIEVGICITIVLHYERGFL